jgi:transmembrane sensor
MNFKGSFSEERFWELFSRKLTNEISVSESDELQQLLLVYPEFGLQAELFNSIWQNKNSSNPDEISGALTAHLLKYNEEFSAPYDYNAEEENGFNNGITPQPSTNKRVTFAFAGIFVLLVAISVFAFLHQDSIVVLKPNISSVSTKNGNRSKITLPDGTQVWLNAGSKLEYDNTVFNKKLREVSLSGEAYFDVVKNTEIPFIVHSGNMNVRVVGTAFNIKAYPGEGKMETSLIRGSVEVTLKNRPQEKYFLDPNEKFVVSDIPVAEKLSSNKKNITTEQPSQRAGIKIEPIVFNEKKDSSIVETAWIYNRLEFHRNENFREIASQMEHWYGVEIYFADEEISKYRLYGSFTNETITEALDALKMIAKFNYKTNGNKITINKK